MKDRPCGLYRITDKVTNRRTGKRTGAYTCKMHAVMLTDRQACGRVYSKHRHDDKQMMFPLTINSLRYYKQT